MKRALVTGASGFIGRHTLAALAQRGFEVHAIGRGAPGEDVETRWHRCDLFQQTEVRSLLERVQPTHLLHAAWFVEHGKFWNSPENLRCLHSSLALFRSFADIGGQRLVAVGTCYEYDLSCGWLKEDTTPLNPESLYGVTKDCLRRLLAATYEHSELSWAWGRIFFPYGPHEGPNRLVANVVQSLLRGESTRCSAGTQIRDFMHVEDVGLALAAVLDSDARGPINICSGTADPIRRVVEIVGEHLGRPDLVRLGDLPMGNQPPLLVGDAGRLARDTDFAGSRSLYVGLQETVHWWKSQAIS